ncbi:MAG: hypothetical protein KDA61_08415, partial [Planctomycetales bacterium]|nr:hypothetical protein [Planctomycetales bacterium]
MSIAIRLWRGIACVLLVVASVGEHARAGFDGFNVDSAAFANNYAAADVLITDWAINGGLTEGELTVVNGDNLLLSQANNNGWIELDGGATPWEAGTGSWSVEVRAKVSPNADAGGFVVWAALDGQRDVLTIRENAVTNLAGDLFDSSDNTNDFHNFRIVYDSTTDAYHYFRDAVQLTPLAGVGPQAATTNTRLIVGDCCTNIAGTFFGGAGNTVEFDYIRFDMNGAYSPTSDPGAFKLTINRETGAITLVNSTSAPIENIIGYSIASPGGSLDPSGWNRISAGAPLLANNNDNWTQLSATNSRVDLSEAVLATSGDGNGGDMAAGSGVAAFGNVWVQSPHEDVEIELLLNDGSSLVGGVDFAIEYEGAPIVTGDVSGSGGTPDGTIDLLDWLAFRANVGSDVSALSLAAAYQKGDLNGDLAVNAADFNLFVAAYEAANGMGSFAAIASVPEPATFLLIAAACVPLARRRRTGAFSPHRAVRRLYAVALPAAACGTLLLGGPEARAASDFVISRYDADAGDPANAAAIQSPELQGWTEWASGAQAQDPTVAVQQGVIGAGGVNAWLNDDVGNTNPGYFIDINPTMQKTMYDFGWNYEVVMTMTNG